MDLWDLEVPKEVLIDELCNSKRQPLRQPFWLAACNTGLAEKAGPFSCLEMQKEGILARTHCFLHCAFLKKPELFLSLS